MTLAVAEHQGTIEFAKMLAAADLLPPAFVKKPANVLLAIELGHALALNPVVAMQQINVIGGKPTLSAQLMVTLARNAGHKVRIEGDDHRAVASLIRLDDPGYTYTAEWDEEKARRGGLWGRGHWTKDPGLMLKWRAAAEVVRLACSEVLAGLPSSEETRDWVVVDDQPQPVTVAEIQAAQGDLSHANPKPAPDTDQPQIDTETATQAPQTAAPAPPQVPAEAGGAASGASPAARRKVATVKPLDPGATHAQLATLRALLRAHNGTLTDLVAPIVGHRVHVATELTQPEAELVIGELQAQLLRAQEPELPDDDGSIPPPEDET